MHAGLHVRVCFTPLVPTTPPPLPPLLCADICAEWDNGGFPHWFASSEVRCSWATRASSHSSHPTCPFGKPSHPPYHSSRLSLSPTLQVAGGRTMRMRTNDPPYLAHVDRWWGVLFAKLRRFLIEEGGPILMVQARFVVRCGGACCVPGWPSATKRSPLLCTNPSTHSE